MENIHPHDLCLTTTNDSKSKVFNDPWKQGGMEAEIGYRIPYNSVQSDKVFTAVSQKMSDEGMGKGRNTRPVQQSYNSKKVLNPRLEQRISKQVQPVYQVGWEECYTPQHYSTHDKTGMVYVNLDGKQHKLQSDHDLDCAELNVVVRKQLTTGSSAPFPNSDGPQNLSNVFEIIGTEDAEGLDDQNFSVEQVIENRLVDTMAQLTSDINAHQTFNKPSTSVPAPVVYPCGNGKQKWNDDANMYENANLSPTGDLTLEDLTEESLEMLKTLVQKMIEEQTYMDNVCQNGSVHQETQEPSCDPPWQQCDSELQIGSTETTHGNRDGILYSPQGSFLGGSVTSFPLCENLTINQTFVENGVNANADSMGTALTPEELMKFIGGNFLEGECSNEPSAVNIREPNETTDGLQKPITQAERKTYSVPQTPIIMETEIEISTPAKQRATCMARRRTLTKGKSVKKAPKMQTQENEVLPVSNPNLESSLGILEEAPQIRKRIVKGRLREKLMENADRKRPSEYSPPSGGKRMRRDSILFTAASPMSELASQAEHSLVLCHEGEEAEVTCPTFSNVPNFALFDVKK